MLKRPKFSEFLDQMDAKLKEYCKGQDTSYVLIMVQKDNAFEITCEMASNMGVTGVKHLLEISLEKAKRDESGEDEEESVFQVRN